MIKQLTDIVFALIGSAMIGMAVVFLDGYAVNKKPVLPDDIEEGGKYEK